MCMGASYRRPLGMLGLSDFSQMQQPASGIFDWVFGEFIMGSKGSLPTDPDR